MGKKEISNESVLVKTSLEVCMCIYIFQSIIKEFCLLGVKPSTVQGLLLHLHSEVTPGMLGDYMGIEPRSATCKANVLLTVGLFQPLLIKVFNGIRTCLWTLYSAWGSPKLGLQHQIVWVVWVTLELQAGICSQTLMHVSTNSPQFFK